MTISNAFLLSVTLFMALQFFKLLVLTYGLTRLITTYGGERWTEGKLGHLLNCFHCSGLYAAALSLWALRTSPGAADVLLVFTVALLLWEILEEK